MCEKAKIEGQKSYGSRCSASCCTICYPGSEIPDWFEFRGMESSGSVQLPRGLFQNNLIGIVVCAIVKYSESSKSEDVEFACYSDDELCCYWKVIRNDNILIQGARKFMFPLDDSDHVMLCREMSDNLFVYGFDESLYNDEVLIRFSAGRNGVSCWVVKEWGIRFLFRQDSREFMKDFSSDEESNDEQEGPDPKRFKLSTRESESEEEIDEEDDEDSNEGESESEEESNDEQEGPDPKRWKLSTGESESEEESDDSDSDDSSIKLI